MLPNYARGDVFFFATSPSKIKTLLQPSKLWLFRPGGDGADTESPVQYPALLRCVAKIPGGETGWRVVAKLLPKQMRYRTALHPDELKSREFLMISP